jgi:signal transduction histidine kinase
VRDPEEGLTHEAKVTSWRRAGDEIARVMSAVGLERSARLVAVALVPVFLDDDTVRQFVPLYTALIVYVLITSFAPRNRFLRAADLLVAAGLIVASGGAVSPFILFLLVAVAGPAARGGLLAGVAAGGTLTVVLITTLAATHQLGEFVLAELLPIGLLLPLAGVTVGAAAQLYADGKTRDRRMLQEANRLLSALRAIADDLPGGLDVTTVAAALVAEVRALEGAKAVLVYAFDDGLLKPVASSGLSPGTLPVLRVDQLRDLTRPGRARLRSLSHLPDQLHEPCGAHRWWVLTGMYRTEDLVGTLLVGVDDPNAARAARPHLVGLAGDGALALQNAQLFDGTRSRAAQAARSHLAGDLHDGVAQALAHLRMELELLARADPDRDGGELGRLAAVARTALQDLRVTIGGLRHPGNEDVAEAIRRHIDFLSKQYGTRLEFEHTGDTRVSAVVGDELLRVTQEAVSNALRHARAQRIRVTLEGDTELLRLAIEDDGRGLDSPSRQRGGGVGIRSMHERASRLGGRLSFGVPPGGGTVVELRCPSPGQGTRTRPPLPTPREPTRQAGLETGRATPRATGRNAPVPPAPGGVPQPSDEPRS